MNAVKHFLKLVRPKQWIKNLFVVAPLVFAKELFELGAEWTTLRAFVGFCITASAVYIINDMVDVEADRAHPDKRKRPLASGVISLKQAYGVLAVLLIGVILVVRDMDTRYITILALYFLINLAYSLKLKEIVLLDVFIVASGFMLRVLAGAYAINVQVSSWIVLCTLFISLFLGFAKRRGEIVLTQGLGTASERKVLSLYRLSFVDQMLTIAAAATVISYALYTVAPRTIDVFGTDKMIYTTVFVIYGIFRYLYLIHASNSTENPTNAVTSDIPIVVTVALWVTACVLLIYFRGQVPFLVP